MADVVLRTVGLGKMYRIGAEREKYRTLRDTITSTAKRPLERMRNPGAATHASKDLWALRDVDIEVKDGEVLGIVGRNGAGKSTLLKVLSHITEPSEGRVAIRGRVASLLEVGTGFHSELTGRENIYLNSAILGMSRAETKARFDEIVEFSEIGKFLDTPVKRYSSGMYVRLAFAVAAHLEPEVLIVDEVLAVGDAGFQQKCLGRMGEVSRSGRTVLFVSHNMQAVRNLCTRAVELEGGRLVQEGPVTQVTDAYLARQSAGSPSPVWYPTPREKPDVCELESISVANEDCDSTGTVVTSAAVTIQMNVALSSLPEGLCIGFDLSDTNGSVVLRSYQTDSSPEQWPTLRLGSQQLVCRIPPGWLNQGRYVVLPRIGIHNVRWIYEDADGARFDAVRDHFSSRYGWAQRPGSIAPALSWVASDG